MQTHLARLHTCLATPHELSSGDQTEATRASSLGTNACCEDFPPWMPVHAHEHRRTHRKMARVPALIERMPSISRGATMRPESEGPEP